MRRILLVLVCMALFILDSLLKVQPDEPAGLSALPPETLAPGHIKSHGDGNYYRFVTGKSVRGQPTLELAAGAHGRIEYSREIEAGPEVTGRFCVQFLSTQGTGQVVLMALDKEENSLGSVCWLVSGPDPGIKTAQKLFDKRLSVNYRGDWLTEEWAVAEFLKAHLPGSLVERAAKYRLVVISGEGQHVLVSDANFAADLARSVRVTPLAPSLQTVLGDYISIEADVENIGKKALASQKLTLVEPYGYGVMAVGPKERTIDSLKPGEKVRLTFTVKAQRPDLVNRGKPWPVALTLNDNCLSSVAVAVSDPRPGKVFYVMTEDLEPIDSAGYPKRWGNATGWLEPQEFQVQLVAKAEKLNTIAEKYGAKWTHYIAWPAVKAAEWVITQSGSPEWKKTVAAIRASVTEQSARGHEYALHLHSDYDPDLPDNILSYNAALDGFWANHRRHGWAHSVTNEGDFDTYNSRTGMLYHYQRILDALCQDSGQGQIITARAGSYDFGAGDEDEALSTKAYQRVGLWGSSDADGNIGGLTAADFGSEIYLAKPHDINSPADNLASTGLVEFRPTPRDMIMYDNQSASVMNSKTDQGMRCFAPGGQIKPGVHAIIGFTHAMFVLGDGDWRSTDGGQFAEIDKHLWYLKNHYADKGMLRFAAAGELVREYLDYYTPVPVVIYGAKVAQATGMVEYALQVLGRDIPVDSAHPHSVSVKLPLYLRDAALYIQVRKNGEPIYDTWDLPPLWNDVPFSLDDPQAAYTLRVYYDDGWAALKRIFAEWQEIHTKIIKRQNISTIFQEGSRSFLP